MARCFTRLWLMKYLAIPHADSCNKSYIFIFSCRVQDRQQEGKSTTKVTQRSFLGLPASIFEGPHPNCIITNPLPRLEKCSLTGLSIVASATKLLPPWCEILASTLIIFKFWLSARLCLVLIPPPPPPPHSSYPC